MDIETIIASARRPEKIVPLCLRADLQATFESLERDFAVADTEITDDVLTGGSSARAAKIAQQMEDTRQKMQESTVLFRLRALPRETWQEIVKANPPNDEDEGDVNEEGFVTALVAGCVIAPPMTGEQATRLRDTITDGQWQELANTAWDLNKNMTTIPFSLAASTRLALLATDT